jgi:hypothetical protein
MRGWIGFAAALAAAALGNCAQGAIVTVTGAAGANGWNQFGLPFGAPFGMPDAPIPFSVTIDTRFADARAFRSISYTTGTRTWTLADLESNSQPVTCYRQLCGFALYFDSPGDKVVNQLEIVDIPPLLPDSGSQIHTAIVSDQNYVVVGAVTSDLATPITPLVGVPEPATWATMLIGVAGLGALRRQRRAWTS